MAYKKIYYDDIWEITLNSYRKCGEWLDRLSKIQAGIKKLEDTDDLKGQAADHIKDYMSEIHGVLIAVLESILKTYAMMASSYQLGYTNSVDPGDKKVRFTTIVFDEVNSASGSVEKKIGDLKALAAQVAGAANSVKYSVSNLVYISARPNINNLNQWLDAASYQAKTVHDKAVSFEGSRAHDFDEIDRLIAQARSIINRQLGQSRTPVALYQSGSVASMCDIGSINADLDAVKEKCEEISASADYKNGLEYFLSRDEVLKEEREWAQWVVVGVAVVGAVVLTVVTLGTASVGACAVVGALVGAGTAATEKFAESYIETGDKFAGVDWNEFARDVTIGAVTGAISGALGAVSAGSAIKQPMEKAVWAFSKTAVEKGAEGILNTAWDVGEAVIAKKPGDEIVSILEDDVAGMLKDITIEGGADFVEEFVLGNFAVNTSDKDYFRKLGENVVKNAAKNTAKGEVSLLWDLGECLLDPESSKNVPFTLEEYNAILEKNAKETLKGFVGDTVSDAISEIPKIDDIENKVGKVTAQTLRDTAADTAEKVAEGVTERGMEYLYEGGEAEDILGDWWEEDLKGGREILESAGKSLGKNISTEVGKDKQFSNDLKKSDYDKDGKVEVVQFGDYAIKKEDYDAAVSVAGKDAYKEKTVQDILGLPKDTDLSSGKVRNVRIDMLEEYSSPRKTTDTVTVDGKYTYKTDFYEAAVNAAGKGDYKDKTVQDILGISNDVDISEDNITRHRYKNADIGRGKEAELSNDDSSLAKKLHISSMKHETKVAREKDKNTSEKQKTDS